MSAHDCRANGNYYRGVIRGQVVAGLDVCIRSGNSFRYEKSRRSGIFVVSVGQYVGDPIDM